METKTELPKEWIDYSVNEYSYNPDEQVSFMDGAKAMRDAMEKKIKYKIENLNLMAKTFGTKPTNSVSYHLYQELLTELTEIKPTQDGK